MKILYISSSEIPSRKANSLHVMQMAEALSGIGNDVSLLAKKGRSFQNCDPNEYYRVMNNFDLVRFRHLNIRFIGNLIYSLNIAFRVFRTKKCELIYTRFPFWSLFFTPKDVPIIYESHALPNSTFRSYTEKRLLRNQNISRIVFISNALKDDYLKLWPWLDESIMFVAPDAAKYPDTKEVNTNSACSIKNVGYVGSFYKGKAVEILSELIKRCSEITFHLIGDTDCIPQRYAKVFKSKNVIKYGYVRPSELPKYYKYFDIALLPISKSVYGANQKQDISRWTSPLKLFEYMANRKCIIASNLPVIQEVLTKDINSLLVDVDDIDGWVNAIIKVASNISFKNKLMDRARADFEKNFTWEIRAKNIMASLAVVKQKIA